VQGPLYELYTNSIENIESKLKEYKPSVFYPNIEVLQKPNNEVSQNN
jgi:hypothetical protein